jgi:hypothetical protein
LNIAIACVVENCASKVTCSNATNAQCDECIPGFFLVNGTADNCTRMLFYSLAVDVFDVRFPLLTLVGCTPVQGCAKPVRCVKKDASTCIQCTEGYYLNSTGTQDRCIGE